MNRVRAIFIGFAALALCSFGAGNHRSLHGKLAAPAQDSPFFLIISDIHLNTCRNEADINGDTDPSSWGLAKAALKKLIDKNPRFVLFTGDLPAHHGDVKSSCDCGRYPIDFYRRKDYDTLLQNFYSIFKGRATPFFFVPGNNDVVEADYGGFTQNNENVFTDLKGIYKYPALNIGADKTTFPYIDSLDSKNCYYSACVAAHLRLIVLNSMVFCTNEGNTCSLEDGFKELNWMKAELQKAKDKRQNVYIAMHIPPGENDKHTVLWKKQLKDDFLACIHDYKNTVTGIFYGHLHTDQFRFLYTKQNDSIMAVAFSCPAITSYKHGNNPGFKMVCYDNATAKITDVVTYFRNIDNSANKWQYYSYSKIFNCPKGTGFTSSLENQGATNLAKLSEKSHAIYFLYRNADKGSADYPDAAEMQVKW